MPLLPFSSSVWELVYSAESKFISQVLLVINMIQAYQSGKCWTCVVLLLLIWSSACPVCESTRDGRMVATNFLPFPSNGQNLTTVSILASSMFQLTTDINSLKLCILKPCLILFYPLLDPMEDLLNAGKAPLAYWLWGVLGHAGWDTMRHLLRSKIYGHFLSWNCSCLPSVYTSLYWNNLWKS